MPPSVLQGDNASGGRMQAPPGQRKDLPRVRQQEHDVRLFDQCTELRHVVAHGRAPLGVHGMARHRDGEDVGPHLRRPEM